MREGSCFFGTEAGGGIGFVPDIEAAGGITTFERVKSVMAESTKGDGREVEETEVILFGRLVMEW